MGKALVILISLFLFSCANQDREIRIELLKSEISSELFLQDQSYKYQMQCDKLLQVSLLFHKKHKSSYDSILLLMKSFEIEFKKCETLLLNNLDLFDLELSMNKSSGAIFKKLTTENTQTIDSFCSTFHLYEEQLLSYSSDSISQLVQNVVKNTYHLIDNSRHCNLIDGFLLLKQIHSAFYIYQMFILEQYSNRVRVKPKFNKIVPVIHLEKNSLKQNEKATAEIFIGIYCNKSIHEIWFSNDTIPVIAGVGRFKLNTSSTGEHSYDFTVRNHNEIRDVYKEYLGRIKYEVH